MDWNICIICQKKTKEALTCPKRKPTGNASATYELFLENLNQFRTLTSPWTIILPKETTANDLVTQDASWHRSCHQKYNKDKLSRLLSRQSGSGDAPNLKRSKRSMPPQDRDFCVFCDDRGTSKLRTFRKENTFSSLKKMATDLQDSSMISKIVCNDFLAQEFQYHLDCLAEYRNQHRSLMRKSGEQTEQKMEVKKLEALEELIAHIRTEMLNGEHIFKLIELSRKYESLLLDHDVSYVINPTRLKEKLLLRFSDMGLQEQSDGKSTILTFPAGITGLLQNAKKKEDEIELFSKVASVCREEIFNHRSLSFEEHRLIGTPDAPKTKQLLSMILFGTDGRDVNDTLPCSTLTELLIFNAKKSSTSKDKRSNTKREPPLPVYIGLSVHTASRDKQMVEQLAKLGLSASYKRVMEIENSIAVEVCHQTQNEGIVCPANLRKGLFTVSAIDNIDHNYSSTSAIGSFHGTGISLMQQPSCDCPGEPRVLPSSERIGRHQKPELPASYSAVPNVSSNCRESQVPERTTTEITGELEKAKQQEHNWISHALSILPAENLMTSYQTLSWSAYHASKLENFNSLPALTGLLPLFNVKSDSPSMIKHSMDIIKQATDYLNPGQLPIIAADCPIYAISKFIQWTYPDLYGEDKLIMMFGGLHLEKGLWTALGDLLDCSGWTSALKNADIATSGTAESFLKSSHITRTRHAHQVTVLALAHLQRQAFEATGREPIEFEDWKKEMCDKNPTFLFWDKVLQIELMVLIVIRAHRENNFALYVETLESLMFLFFALDHYHYSRWLAVHIRDMKSIPDEVRSQIKEQWVINKTGNRFSFIPLDQTHEQENAKVKGRGGAVGLLDSAEALNRWVMSGPEQARLLSTFEKTRFSCEKDEHLHHEENVTSQVTFQQQVNSVVRAISEFGSPFEGHCTELIILDTRQRTAESVMKAIQTIETLGTAQYKKFREDVFIERKKSISNSIAKNKLPLFRTMVGKGTQKTSATSTDQSQKNVFGQLFIINHQEKGNLDEFFAHENQNYPPSLCLDGKPRRGKKSELLKCLQLEEGVSTEFDCTVIDGPALVHMLPTTGLSTLENFAKEVFIPYLLNESDRVDVVWDDYRETSIKACLREERGDSRHIDVQEKTPIPSNWSEFLLNTRNKKLFFSLLTKLSAQYPWPEGKTVHFSNGQQVTSNHTPLPNVPTHEEADARIVYHIADAISNRARKIKVRTVDTDVLVILTSQFEKMKGLAEDVDITVVLGTGKQCKNISINKLYLSLGSRISRSLVAFHAFTGTDTTSAFFGRGKTTGWSTWMRCQEVTDAFLFIAENPFKSVDESSTIFQLLQKFTVRLFDKCLVTSDINVARRKMFEKGKDPNNLPPTKDALVQHIRRVVYQTGIWMTSHLVDPQVPSPETCGWKKDGQVLTPMWTTQPTTARMLNRAIHCSCKKECKICKCRKLGLLCNERCHCQCSHAAS